MTISTYTFEKGKTLMNRYEKHIIETGKTTYPLTEGDQAHYLAVLRDHRHSENIDWLQYKTGYVKDVFGNFWMRDKDGVAF